MRRQTSQSIRTKSYIPTIQAKSSAFQIGYQQPAIQSNHFFRLQHPKQDRQFTANFANLQATNSNPIINMQSAINPDLVEHRRSQHQLKRKLHNYMANQYNTLHYMSSVPPIDDISSISPRDESRLSESFQGLDFISEPAEPAEPVQPRRDWRLNSRTGSSRIKFSTKRSDLIIQVYQQPQTLKRPFFMQGAATSINKREIQSQSGKLRIRD